MTNPNLVTLRPRVKILIFLSVSGAELVDSVLDVVRKEAESCDCLQVSFLISVYV